MRNFLSKTWAWIKRTAKKVKTWVVVTVLGGTVLALNLAGIPPESLTNYQLAEKCVTDKGGVVDCLVDLTIKEKANLKGQEIAKKTQLGIYENTQYGVRVEILEVNTIEGGVEVFARAWRGGEQLGFGSDGSVDIERFLSYNPPILVKDPNGPIVREWISEITGEPMQRKFREDLLEALRQDLAHTIFVSGKEGTEIVAGKLGSTISTFRPAAGANEPVDGYSGCCAGNQSWSNVQSQTGSSTNGPSGTNLRVSLTSSSTDSSNWRDQQRSWAGFDTSPITPDTVDSGTFSLVGNTEFAVQADNHDINITGGSGPADTASIATGDYEIAKFNATLLSDNGIGNDDMDVGGSTFNNWTLNGDGITAIVTDGLTWIAVRHLPDITNTEPPNYAGQQDVVGLLFDSADTAGTTTDPKLVVDHEAAGAAAPRREIIGSAPFSHEQPT